jgi:hypothetical protein
LLIFLSVYLLSLYFLFVLFKLVELIKSNQFNDPNLKKKNWFFVLKLALPRFFFFTLKKFRRAHSIAPSLFFGYML